MGSVNRRVIVQAGSGINRDPIQKGSKSQKGWAVWHKGRTPAYKHKALSATKQTNQQTKSIVGSGWGYSLGVEYLPSIGEGLGLIPTPQKKN
jgi:hypothetical protein